MLLVERLEEFVARVISLKGLQARVESVVVELDDGSWVVVGVGEVGPVSDVGEFQLRCRAGGAESCVVGRGSDGGLFDGDLRTVPILP